MNETRFRFLNEERKRELVKNWRKFSSNPLSIVGLISVLIVLFLAIFAPWVAPYPQSWGRWVDFNNVLKPPSWTNWMGTDNFGRDIMSRIFFGFRYDLMMAAAILVMVVPLGTILGLIAGYFSGTFIDTIIMRVTDVFLAIPSLVLALAICSLLEPSLFNSMMAVSVLWWPWYSRLSYGIAISLKNEYFVQASELIGASTPHILFREILPNCLSPIFTKMTLDVGWVILIGASLAFVGLGAQEPIPALGNMVSAGTKYMPDYWWMTIFPAIAIAFTILGFNLLGDGIRDLLAVEEV
ncbi:ABC transporter permease [Candidatus Bathyarchaeota archaeon]|nr:ABC transporter permease [Candidatus Bathyarchaeota archaeon]